MSLHTLHFISGWKDGGTLTLNEFFDRNGEITVARIASQSLPAVHATDGSDTIDTVVQSDANKAETPLLNSPTEVEEIKKGVMAAEESADVSAHTSGCPVTMNNAEASVATFVNDSSSDFVQESEVTLGNVDVFGTAMMSNSKTAIGW